MNIPCRIVISLLLLGLSLPASAAINAWLDQDQISPGETVQLTLQHDGQTSSQPDLGPLRGDFEIIGQSTSSNVQIINGKMTSQVQLSLTLIPKHSGKLLVPALQWDGQFPPVLTLTVGGSGAAGQAGNAPAGNNSHVFITTMLDQKRPYVQAAVTLTVRLYVDEPLYQPNLEFQSNNDVLVQQLGQDRQSSEVLNGRNYQVVERKYLLFPQRSGRIQLDGPVLNAQVQVDNNTNSLFSNIFGRDPFSGMLNDTRPIRIQGDPVVLNVLPRPDSAAGHAWLPAQNVTLQEIWQPDNGTVHAGDPITRHLHLSALGLTAAQLPDLSRMMPLPTGIRAYPDQPEMKNSAQGDSVIGTRDQDIALIAGSSGRYVIPALHLFWWDTTKNIQREIDLPAHTLDVLPGAATISAGTLPPDRNTTMAVRPSAGPSAPARIPGSSTKGYRWDWISLALAVLWLGTLAAWWRSSRRNPQRPSSGPNQPTEAPVSTPRMAEARNAFRQACRENNPLTARRHLLDWAHATWPQHPPIGLKALAKRLDAPALEPLLNQLDRACYAGGEWRGETLLNSLKALSGRPGPAAGTPPELAGLYP
jgi:BatD DUF11 like domain